MIGIPLGLVASNVGEWLIHKHILHGRGRKKGSFWSFHLEEHHRAASLLGGRDPAYEKNDLQWNARTKEALALLGAAVLQLPLLPIAPFFAGTILYGIGRYYVVHRKAHLDPEWARQKLPWHYDHHMGPNPECNWGVTHPWFDQIVGTRVPFAGTNKDPLSRAKAA